MIALFRADQVVCAHCWGHRKKVKGISLCLLFCESVNEGWMDHCLPPNLLDLTVLCLAAAANVYQTIMPNCVELIVPKRANSFALQCGTLETNNKLCILFI